MLLEEYFRWSDGNKPGNLVRYTTGGLLSARSICTRMETGPEVVISLFRHVFSGIRDPRRVDNHVGYQDA